MKPALVLLLACWLPLAAGAQVLGRQPPPRASAESWSTAHSARSLFVVHCAGCHGMDGAGSDLGRVPDMRGMGHFLRVAGGREFLIQVPGVLGSGLNDEQVASVTNWLLAGVAAASVPEGHRPYAAAEVRAARANPPLDVAATRQRLVDAARSQGLALN